MFERFTDRARRVTVLAQDEARMLGHAVIGTEHILLGILHEGESVAALALKEFGINLIDARLAVEAIYGKGIGPASKGPIPFTPRSKKILELSLREALQLGSAYIGVEHILLGLIREGNGYAAKVISQDVDLPILRQKVMQLLNGFASSTPESGFIESPSNNPITVQLEQLQRNVAQTAKEFDKLRSRTTPLAKPKLSVDPDTGVIDLTFRVGASGYVAKSVVMNGPMADSDLVELDDPANKAHGIWIVHYDAFGNVVGVEVT